MEGVSPVEPTRGMPNTMTPFAELLRALRAAAELTQEELAGRAGLSVRAISDLERGVKLRPQRATIRLLCVGLELSDADRAALEASVPGRHRGHRVAASLDLPVGGFLGSVPDRSLVARSSEVERVRALIKSVNGGAGRLLLLTGEPGVGKTRLAQEMTLICRANGMHLATGQCYETQQAVAHYPFLEVLNRLVPAAWSALGADPVNQWPQLRALIPSRCSELYLERPAGRRRRRPAATLLGRGRSARGRSRGQPDRRGSG